MKLYVLNVVFKIKLNIENIIVFHNHAKVKPVTFFHSFQLLVKMRRRKDSFFGV